MPEVRSTDCRGILTADSDISLWWSTPIEVASGIARRLREGTLASPQAAQARRASELIIQRCMEVAPSDQIRTLSLNLVRQHPLSAADASQLAAAIVAFGGTSAVVEFVCLDDRLRQAALAEGANVYP